jgi:hypothetical protein
VRLKIFFYSNDAESLQIDFCIIIVYLHYYYKCFHITLVERDTFFFFWHVLLYPNELNIFPIKLFDFRFRKRKWCRSTNLHFDR